MNGRSLGEHFDNRNNNLNLMRLLAAFAVIYGHATAITGNGPSDYFLQLVGYKFIGGVAVDIFFVISGFLITASAMSHNGLIYFLASRILRIYPALIVCVVLTVFVLGAAVSTSDDYFSSTQTWSYLWQNATAYGTEYFLPGVFQNLHDKAVNGSLWSLPIEVRLYLIILLFSLFGILLKRPIFNMVFFFIIISGYLVPETWVILFVHENHRHVAMMFMIGAFCWINRNSIPINPALLLLLLFFAAAQHKTENFGGAYSILLAYTVFYIAFAPGGAWFNRFGDYSYGVYLYGWIAQQIVMLLLPDSTNALNVLFACALAFFFAFFSWHVIEKPALRIKRYFKASA